MKSQTTSRFLQRNDAAAELLFRRVIDIAEKALGSDHPSMASSLNNLAMLLKEQVSLVILPTFCMICDARAFTERTDVASVDYVQNVSTGRFSIV